MTVQPFTPQDIEKYQAERPFPDFVIQAVNQVLAENYHGSATKINQNKFIDKIIELAPQVTRSDIFQNNWLDFEPLYRSKGWHVTYEKGAYYEENSSYFTFKWQGHKE